MKTLTSLLSVALLLATAPGTAYAQSGTTVEIGTQGGLSILRDGGGTVTTIALPGGGFGGSAVVYATLFGSSGAAFEPRLGFRRSSSDGSSFSILDAAGRVKYLVRGAEESSAYFFGEGALVRGSGGSDSETEFGAGAGVGLRHLARPQVAVNLEAGYRRWFDAEMNEFTLSLGVGVVIDRSSAP